MREARQLLQPGPYFGNGVAAFRAWGAKRAFPAALDVAALVAMHRAHDA